MRLLDIERASHGLKRRHAVHTRIEEAFKLEWRDYDVVVAERRSVLGLTDAGDTGDLGGDEFDLPFDGEANVR
jgi:DNA sulfur modification protein DndC